MEFYFPGTVILAASGTSGAYKNKDEFDKKDIEKSIQCDKEEEHLPDDDFHFWTALGEMVLLIYTVFSTGKKKYRCWGCFSYVDKGTEMRSIPQNIYCILRQLLRGEKIVVATLTYSQWYSAIGFLIEPSGVVHHHWSCLF